MLSPKAKRIFYYAGGIAGVGVLLHSISEKLTFGIIMGGIISIGLLGSLLHESLRANNEKTAKNQI